MVRNQHRRFETRGYRSCGTSEARSADHVKRINKAVRKHEELYETREPKLQTTRAPKKTNSECGSKARKALRNAGTKVQSNQGPN